MTSDDVGVIAVGLAELTAGIKKPDKVVEAFGVLLSAVVNLDARLKAVEATGVKYRGVFQAAQEYARGDLVTFDGSVFHANVATRKKPGNGSTDWTLAVKRGADGKDVERKHVVTAVRQPTGMRR